MALLYNLVRLEMERIAALAPSRTAGSGRASRRPALFQNACTRCGTRFCASCFRREVKIKMSKFPRKRTAATHPEMALN